MEILEAIDKVILLLSGYKYLKPFLFLLAAYFIFRFGKSIGEFIWYITHR